MPTCALLSRASWNAPVIVTEEARSELQLWKKNAKNLNDSGKSLDRKTFYEVSLFADASSKEYGGYIEVNENSLEEGNENRKLEEGTCRPPDEGMVKYTASPLRINLAMCKTMSSCFLCKCGFKLKVKLKTNYVLTRPNDGK